MKKIILLAAAFLAITVSSLFAQELDELLEKYNANQKKIETFIARGVSTSRIFRSDGSVLRTIESPMSLFLKRPNKLKLITESPAKTTFVQHGDYVTQKIEGQGGAITTKADEKTNLLNFYFGQDIPGYQGNNQIVEKETVIIEGKTLYRFKINISGGDMSVAIGDELDSVEVYFNEDGMVTKTVLLSGEKAVITSEVSYVQKKDVFVPKTIITSTATEGTRMESAIIYTTVNVNIDILDREFNIY